MTMEPNHHPDDERLAAFAAGEPDVELRIHVQSCVRCRSVVDELTTLRTALAELPDLAPSRPLRLLPEVLEPEPSAAERLAGWTRRAFMPLLAAGFGLAIVGSVGTAGSIFSFSLGSAGAAPAGAPLYRDASVPTPTAAAAAAAPGATKTPGEAPAAAGDSASGSPQPERAGSATSSPAPEPAVKAFEQPPTSTPRSLWPMVLFAGVALIVATLLLRWIVQPRAG
ncbi:MAG: hypothetical protein M3O77_01440 [Chloroflexota bacterium]|nr:hypothetical protein [Chloroflexota bacterium]